MSRFSERFKSLRLSRHLSQQALANQLGNISKSSVNMYERGEREPSIETLEAIADFFNVDMDYLLGNSDNPNKYGDLMAYLNEEYRRTSRTDSSTDIQNTKIKSNLSNIEIGNRLKEIRETRGLTIKELADRVDVDDSVISIYEKGQFNKISKPLVELIGMSLDVNPRWLIGQSDEKNILQRLDCLNDECEPEETPPHTILVVDSIGNGCSTTLKDATPDVICKMFDLLKTALEIPYDRIDMAKNILESIIKK